MENLMKFLMPSLVPVACGRVGGTKTITVVTIEATTNTAAVKATTTKTKGAAVSYSPGHLKVHNP